MISSAMAEQATFVRFGDECGKDGVGWWRWLPIMWLGERASWRTDWLGGWIGGEVSKRSGRVGC